MSITQSQLDIDTSTMSDEESFVILGSSPLHSLDEESGLQSNAVNSDNSFCSLKDSQIQAPKNGSLKGIEVSEAVEAAESKQVEATSASTTPGSGTVAVDNSQGEVKNLGNSIEVDSFQKKLNEDLVDSSLTTSVKSNKSLTNGLNGMNSLSSSGKSSIKSGQPGLILPSGDSSLAASFLMGEINADVLKTSVYSQFPSLCSMEACAEDVVKLQNFMTEYLELKNTLAKVNATMKQFYSRTVQWKEEMQRAEERYKQQTDDLQIQIASLRNENMELKREIDTKIEQIQICDNLRKSEQDEMTKTISDQKAQINNMRYQIDKLEQQQLKSFEYIPKNANDSKDKPDYVDCLEHERIVKEKEREMSVLLAENLDLKDVQKQFIDEITCLKVNVVAAEELIKQLKADVNVLKAKDIEKSEIFTKYEREREEQRAELELLRQQVEVYSKDFEIERTSRQNLAGEKEQLLQDLRALQRKNHELIEEAQRQWEILEKRGLLNSNTSVAGGCDSVSRSLIPGAANSATTATTSSSSSTTTSSQQKIEITPAVGEIMNAHGVSAFCPICAREFTSLSVLQNHVNDCLDNL